MTEHKIRTSAAQSHVDIQKQTSKAQKKFKGHKYH